MLNEIWTPVKFNENYEVSTYGRVRRSDNKKEKALIKSNNGYYKVDLYKDGKRKDKGVHRIVMESFVECDDPENKQVNHIDGDKTNNKITNLEWCTRSENMKHAFRTGLATSDHLRGKPGPMKGRKNPNAGSDGKPIRILETGQEFDSAVDCEKELGIRSRGICDVLKGRQHTCGGYHFEYINDYNKEDKFVETNGYIKGR